MEIVKDITGNTKLLGVIGNPLEHTISPQLHNTISKYLGIKAIYVPFKVNTDELENAIKGLKSVNITGFNVTIPFKTEVMKYIDCCSKDALLIGAVNTVKNVKEKLLGYNTDAKGFIRSFEEESGKGFKKMKVALIGAGGAARAVATAVAMEGAERIIIANRTYTNADKLAGLVNNNFGNIAIPYEIGDFDESGLINQCDVIINTTSVGMYPETGKSPLKSPLKLNSNQIVYDLIYNPSKTMLMEQAEKCGCKTVNGLGMLIYQGICAYEIWMDVKIPEELIKEIFISFKGEGLI